MPKRNNKVQNTGKSKKQGGKAATAGQSSKSQGQSKRTSVGVSQSRVNAMTTAKVSGSPYSGDGSIRIVHREFVQDLTSTVAFATTTFALNPGISATFPWLSQITPMYETYSFNSLKFEYETEISTATAGSVQLVVDFDASDPAPSTKQQLMAYHDAVRSALWSECEYTCDRKDLTGMVPRRYLRSAALAANLDIKTYDVGNLQVGLMGSATANCGELYVTYDVTLHTPQLDPSAFLVAAAASGSKKIAPSAGVTRAAPLGTAQTTTGSGGIVVTNTTTLTFVTGGQYMMEVVYAGTVITGPPLLTGTATSGGLNNLFDGGAVNGLAIFVVTATPGQTVIFDFTGSSTTITATALRLGLYQTSLA